MREKGMISRHPLPFPITCGLWTNPLVMDNKLFMLSLVLIGLLSLLGCMFFSVFGIFGVMKKWIKSI